MVSLFKVLSQLRHLVGRSHQEVRRLAEEVSAGGVVYSLEAGQPRILLILDMYGQWTLPKGHVDPGETTQQAALREIEEEVGLRGVIEQDLGETHYQYRRGAKVIPKTVHYYLVRANSTEVRLGPGEVEDAQWLPLDRVLEVSCYDNNQTVLEKAIDVLRKRAA